MAEKILTAKVRLESRDAENALSRLADKIQKIESKIKQLSNGSKLETQLNRQAVSAEKVKQETAKTAILQEKLTQETGKTFIIEEKVDQALSKSNAEREKAVAASQKTLREMHKTAVAEEKALLALHKINAAREKARQTLSRTEALQSKLTSVCNKTQTKIKSISTSVKEWASNQKLVNSMTKSTNSLLGYVKSKLTRIASIYFGIMGAKYAINATDTITKAENKLNYLSAGQLGSGGYNADGGYSDKTLAMTQDAMDKMYASSQKVRMGYGAMMSNVSKMMTLAPDAFQGNTDAAIRFQEIMAESYALGGASADEMSTSMYQLTQALGAGTLAGDELRSVREGAPLAYKAIEEFVQGIYKTDASLKELGADGKITSDMVVAAIMNMGTEADKAFSQTTQTFEQTWEQIKNAALYAFDPIGDKLREVLTKAIDKGLIQKIETAFATVAGTILWLLDCIEIAITWVADNWEKIKPIVVGVLSVITACLLTLAVVSIGCAIKSAIAWATANLPLLVIIATLALIIYFFYLVMSGALTMSEFVVYAIMFIGVAVAILAAIIGSIPMMWVAVGILVLAIVMYYLEYILAGLYWFISVVWNALVTLVMLIVKRAILPLTVAWDNFANFFGNLFTDPVAAIIRCFEKLADSVLSILETIAIGIDSVFGSNLASAVQGWRGGLSSKADELVAKYGNGKYEEKSNVTDKITGILDSVQTKISWNSSDAFDTGMNHGKGVKNWLNGLGDGLKNTFSFDNLGEMIGLDKFEFPNANNPAYDIADAYQRPDDSELLGNINDNTELTADDLKYLRDVANMEWKKEFTTAEIHVEMNNSNTVNGESDLDGLVTKLTEKLYEELDAVANGVYA